MQHPSVFRKAIRLSLHLQHLPEMDVVVEIPGIAGIVQDQSLSAIQEPVFVLSLSVKGNRLREVKTADGAAHPVRQAAHIPVIGGYVSAAGGGFPLVDGLSVHGQRIVLQQLYLPRCFIAELTVDGDDVECRGHAAGSRGHNVVVNGPCAAGLEGQQPGMVSDQSRNGRVLVSDSRLIQVREILGRRCALVQVHA